MKKKLVVVLVVLMLVMLAACGGSNSANSSTPTEPEESTETETPAETPSETPTEAPEATVTEWKKDVVIGTSSPNLTMDVQEITATEDFAAHKSVHEGLFKYNSDTGEYDNWLCESYEMDGADWTLHLRQGVKWHNGEEFTADDVVYTLITRGQKSAQTASFCETLTAEAVDTYTVHVNTGTVNMDFIPRMAHTTYSMISKVACENDPDHGFEVGTGPYVYQELFENSHLKLKRNENYWGEAPTAETIEFRYYAEPSARLIALQNGEIDVCLSPATTELEYIKEDDNLELIENVGATSVYITFNTQKEPYGNLEFRQAVAYAIDDQSVIDIVVDGLGTISNSTFGPNSAVNCDDKLKGYPYDPEKAKELIEKNGWAGTTIHIIVNENAEDSKTAVAVQSMLTAVGLDVKVDQRGNAEVVAARSSGDIEMMVGRFGSSDYPDGVSINCSSAGSYNFARFSDPDIDNMLAEALTVEDWATRKEMYTHVQQIVFDEMCYYYPIFRSNANYAMLKGTTGFTPKSNFVVDYSYIQVPAK